MTFAVAQADDLLTTSRVPDASEFSTAEQRERASGVILSRLEEARRMEAEDDLSVWYKLAREFIDQRNLRYPDHSDLFSELLGREEIHQAYGPEAVQHFVRCARVLYACNHPYAISFLGSFPELDFEREIFDSIAEVASHLMKIPNAAYPYRVNAIGATRVPRFVKKDIRALLPTVYPQLFEHPTIQNFACQTIEASEVEAFSEQDRRVIALIREKRQELLAAIQAHRDLVHSEKPWQPWPPGLCGDVSLCAVQILKEMGGDSGIEAQVRFGYFDTNPQDSFLEGGTSSRNHFWIELQFASRPDELYLLDLTYAWNGFGAFSYGTHAILFDRILSPEDLRNRYGLVAFKDHLNATEQDRRGARETEGGEYDTRLHARLAEVLT